MRAFSMRASAGIALLLATPLLCADAGTIAVHMTHHRVTTDANGKPTLEDASRARPGDVLEYHATYSNTGTKPARDLLATLPVPPNSLEYLPKTAFPEGVLASADGKTFAPAPLVRMVTLPDGKRVMREVPVSEYRYLRWRLGELAPGKSVMVGARMRVVSEQSEGKSDK